MGFPFIQRYPLVQTSSCSKWSPGGSLPTVHQPALILQKVLLSTRSGPWGGSVELHQSLCQPYHSESQWPWHWASPQTANDEEMTGNRLIRSKHFVLASILVRFQIYLKTLQSFQGSKFPPFNYLQMPVFMQSSKTNEGTACFSLLSFQREERSKVAFPLLVKELLSMICE